MTPSPVLPELEQRRDRLCDDLAAVGDFRPGSLSAVMSRCGKPNCVCADPDHPGHGPQHVLTKKVAGKTVTVHLRLARNWRRHAPRSATTSGSGRSWTSWSKSTR